MSVQVELAFTDGQWALILEHLPKRANVEGEYPDALTIALVGAYLEEDIKNQITLTIHEKLTTAQQNAFDV
jgi:hypothetical protein